MQDRELVVGCVYTGLDRSVRDSLAEEVKFELSYE